MDTSPSIVIRLKQSYCQQIGKIKRVIGLMPASFITGFHAAMWLTVVFAVLLLATFARYWQGSSRRTY